MKIAISLVVLVSFFSSCSTVEPTPIKLNTDNCDYCKMTIADLRFASELITEKGKVYKYDDLSCLKNYLSENPDLLSTRIYVSDFDAPDKFLDAKTAMFASGEAVGSPMGGNMAAFAEKQSAENFAKAKNASVLIWNQLP